VRTAVELAVTTAGICWLAPASAVPALLACTVCVLLPLALQPLLVQRDMRVRTHTGSLSLFYLDAFLGLVSIRTHAAARAVRSEHEGLLVEWNKASRSFLTAGVLAEGLQALFGFGLAALLVTSHITGTSDASRVLLLIYWALNLPVLGGELAAVAREYPGLRNTTLRLLEPLGAPEEEARGERTPSTPMQAGAELEPVSVALEQVTVHAAGHVILEGVDLQVAPGSHVAVIGPSGAGKSSLVGLLLGWHQPTTGSLLADGVRLEGERLMELRRRTVWVDPATQLWNRSLLENLRYGTGQGAASLPRVLEQAELLSVLARMPEGLQTPLGEGGGLVSGGEGQRVRLGRAMLQEQVRLVVLDEPFRGLDRERRQRLMLRARELWKGKTLFCITHDVRETLGFERVLVVEGGKIAEDGAPAELAARQDSRYRALLEAEEQVEREIWQGPEWRRLRIEQGQLHEQQPARKTA
jgi:ATP-binding cassette subfamily B protein